MIEFLICLILLPIAFAAVCILIFLINATGLACKGLKCGIDCIDKLAQGGVKGVKDNFNNWKTKHNF